MAQPKVFELNTQMLLDNFNVWTSLAECYYNLKQFDLALEYYEKSLELNPDNSNGTMMVGKIRAETGVE